MSEKTVLRNFVGGEHVDTAEGRRADLVDPSTGEVFGSAPVSGPEDVDRAYAAASSAFETWRDVTPAERQRALLRFADAVEEHADELVALESQNTGKPLGLTSSEEIPPMVDQIRFFAGAARTLEGKAAAEYMAGHTSWIRREPIGVVGQVTPVELPDDDGRLEDRPGDRRGQHRRPQAQRHDAADDAAAGRAGRRHPAGRRVQRRLRRPGHRPRARRAPDPAAGRHHRVGARRDAGRRGRLPRRQAGAPGAGRQGAGGGLRRRRPRGRGRRDRHRRLLQRRPGLHGGDPGAGRAAHPRRLRGRADRAGEEDHHHVRQRRRRRGRPRAPGEQRRPAGPRDRLPRPRPEPRRDHGRRRAARATAASSWSRRSSPACARTTRWCSARSSAR